MTGTVLELAEIEAENFLAEYRDYYENEKVEVMDCLRCAANVIGLLYFRKYGEWQLMVRNTTELHKHIKKLPVEMTDDNFEQVLETKKVLNWCETLWYHPFKPEGIWETERTRREQVLSRRTASAWPRVNKTIDNFVSSVDHTLRETADLLNGKISLIEQSRARTARDRLSKEGLLHGTFRAAADTKKVGEMFEQARTASGLNKVQASKASGIDRKSLRQLENGDHSPSVDTLHRYADALGYEIRIELTPKDRS